MVQRLWAQLFVLSGICRLQKTLKLLPMAQTFISYLIFYRTVLQWFIWIGGAGTTLSLVVLMMFSKSTYLKSLGRLSFLPGLFNINEPVIFGTPIVMNPILGIPFIVAPLITTTLSYFLTVANIIPMMAARLAFAIPAPIAAWMSTNWSFGRSISDC